MVLQIIETLGSRFFPAQYTLHIVIGIATIFALRAFSQGRATTRERDLHARIILVTGGFTPFGSTILQELAQRGAHIIALSSDPIDSPRVALLVDVLRSTTSNEQIFAEQCNLLSPASIHAFCKRFLSGHEKRLDALLFAHEYSHIGAFPSFATNSRARDNAEREQLSLASFLLTTLLLPALLTAPTERDIRIINVVNRFYAAATSSSDFYASLASDKLPAPNSTFLAEGTRSLRTIILTRHLQRILDALPTAQIPKTESNASAIPVVNSDTQKSNIIAVTVSPGISRADTIARMLNADWTLSGYSKIGVILYIIILPILHLFTKSSVAAVQSVLHALFLPTPFKLLSQKTENPTKRKDQAQDSVIDTTTPTEVLKPVEGSVSSPAVPDDTATKKSSGKKREKPSAGEEIESIDLPDDGELGGELAGRQVWEAFESTLKAWEKANPSLEELETEMRAQVDAEQAQSRADEAPLS
ncbi:hypothetical protein D9757_012467 [Collybiopsis confluens]|uniref:Ketoreductase (KR) domain-containing protein n=1 Tax=Collybiopsis confluens TaxID=2823264 RepID=A0A8H5G187_9AGAR|nr:hypothetical protein D9757_012467 [Collybiopsis confluens]